MSLDILQHFRNPFRRHDRLRRDGLLHAAQVNAGGLPRLTPEVLRPLPVCASERNFCCANAWAHFALVAFIWISTPFLNRVFWNLKLASQEEPYNSQPAAISFLLRLMPEV